MGKPPRWDALGGAAEHTSASVTTARLECSPFTARFWRIDYPAGSDITIELPDPYLIGPTGKQVEILNNGTPITIELRGGVSPLNLSLPTDRLASLANVLDPSVLPAAGQGESVAYRWSGIVYEVGARSGLGLLVPPP